MTDTPISFNPLPSLFGKQAYGRGGLAAALVPSTPRLPLPIMRGALAPQGIRKTIGFRFEEGPLRQYRYRSFVQSVAALFPKRFEEATSSYAVRYFGNAETLLRTILAGCDTRPGDNDMILVIDQKSGQWASVGVVNTDLLEEMLAE